MGDSNDSVALPSTEYLAAYMILTAVCGLLYSFQIFYVTSPEGRKKVKKINCWNDLPSVSCYARVHVFIITHNICPDSQ